MGRPHNSPCCRRMKVHAASDVRATHEAVLQLPDKMRATLAAVYLLHMSAADAGLVLDCQADTVLDRVERAQRLLKNIIDQKSFATSDE